MLEPRVGLPVQVFTKEAHPAYFADTPNGPFAATVTFVYSKDDMISVSVQPAYGSAFPLHEVKHVADAKPGETFWRHLEDDEMPVAPPAPEPVAEEAAQAEVQKPGAETPPAPPSA